MSHLSGGQTRSAPGGAAGGNESGAALGIRWLGSRQGRTRKGRNRGNTQLEKKKANPTDPTEAIKASRGGCLFPFPSERRARRRRPAPRRRRSPAKQKAFFARPPNPRLEGLLLFFRWWLEMTHMFPREGASSSSTSMSSQRSETDDDRMIAVVLSEEYAKLDGSMAKRLTNLTSIPHVPRINTYFPTYNDATMDHYRLLDSVFCNFVLEECSAFSNNIYPYLYFMHIMDMEVQLNAYGLFEVRVSGDGNCQFRALSDQLYRSPDYHKHVRKEIVKQLKECNSLYEGYVPMRYKQYCKKMKKYVSGEWGDHVTLQAAADKFAAKICLLTSFRDTCFVEIVPQYQAPQREIWLSFWSEVHYNSLYDARDLPSKYKPRKKHWLLF
ncbi:hypothetical protein U9M48_032403 [Paspalum notatum var. saurae]|uniref:ubiquitinyl hydrolase 1 n=1 Tax=Paspalum notatum var. saurae TaxID=547442 RepID=A0AAQ3X5E3_PASNO